MIYLDHNATSPPAPGVVEAASAAMAQSWGNPSSVHGVGQRARALVELARRSLGALVGVRPGRVVLTSGGTESIAMAIRSGAGRGGTIVTSGIEHAAVGETIGLVAAERGITVVRAPVDGSGVIELDGLGALVAGAGAGALVSVQWANSETGAIQPMERIARVCKDHGAMVHCDATQMVGKEVVDLGLVDLASIDLVSFSPHKFGGLAGVGVLIVGAGVELEPMVPGSQERGLRGGTENLVGIVGAGVAADWARGWLADPGGRERGRELRDELEGLILSGVGGAEVVGPRRSGGRVWNTLTVRLAGVEAQLLVMALAERGVCVSAGSACASGAREPSGALLAMGLDEHEAGEAVRLSLGPGTTRDEIRAAGAAVVACAGAIRGG